MISRKPMNKKIVAAQPAIYQTGCNFKIFPFRAWENCGGKGVKTIYPVKYARWFIQHYDIVPSFWHSSKTARLCFVQPLSLYYDTYSSTTFYEIIPLIWDCWPCYDDKLCKWIVRHHVKACIFTSSEAAKRISERLEYLKILVITEGITLDEYPPGKKLSERNNDVFVFGRWPGYVSKTDLSSLNVVRNGTDEEFRQRLQDSKITINVPRCDVVPEQTGSQETLTQRYWECMLSRMVMVGRAPKELTDLIGYNPVIDIDRENLGLQLKSIVEDIDHYQQLVDRNRETALRMGSWDIRMKQVMEWLQSLGYSI